MAVDTTDYASDTVEAAIVSLRESAGNIDQTFSAYESIGDIITEGKGVGGSINYSELFVNLCV